MARAMRKGAIQFGLVTIPIKLYLATESRAGVSFNMLHAPDLSRIRRCSRIGGRSVQWRHASRPSGTCSQAPSPTSRSCRRSECDPAPSALSGPRTSQEK